MNEDQTFITVDVAVDVVLAAFKSDDDVGVFLRAHHIIEQAAEAAGRAIYENYGALRFDALRGHLRALRARGAQGPIIDAAKVVADTRDDFAHMRTFKVTEKHVQDLQKALRHPQSLDMDRWQVPIGGKVINYPDLKPAHRYFVQCFIIATSIEALGKNFKKALEERDPVEASSRSASEDLPEAE